MAVAAGTRSEWVFGRTEAVARGGMVAAKTEAAAEAGAEVLRRGGNAVDAAVTTAFVAGVVEPWMNGIGGGGFMVVHRPGEEPVVVDYPMVSPAGATPAMFPLSGAGSDLSLFGWPGVVDGANIVGHRAVCVPGTVAGLALALERFGTVTLAEAVEPAIRYADEGTLVTWPTTHYISRDLGNLQKFEATAAIFLDARGNPPFSLDAGHPTYLRQTDLARTLRTVASEGPRAMYEGAIGAAMADHLAANGAPFVREDFARYQASIEPALTVSYHGRTIATTGKGSGGTTLAQALALLDRFDVAELGHNTTSALHLLAQAFRSAFADRFAYLADPDHVHVPLEALFEADYLAERAATIGDGAASGVRAGDRTRLGVHHDLAPSVPDYTKGGSTTHLGAIDKDGMAVSLTQTLLSGWGSRVVVPGTGVLLNNGMMWFDPEPGRPNSVAGRKRPLSNMAPLLILQDGRAIASVGSSGGRRIMNCNAQLVMNLLDHGLTAQPAIAAPRIDASTPDLIVSARLPRETTEALSALGHNVVSRDERFLTGEFASPLVIEHVDGGLFRGGADPYYQAMAVGVAAAE
jgi:gamma-glutamyltranspeptidase / glutathione hydrolase